MLPDRVSNPGPLTYESGALPIVLHGPAYLKGFDFLFICSNSHREEFANSSAPVKIGY